MDKKSVLSLHNMSIVNNSELTALDSSTLAFNITQSHIFFTGTSSPLIHNLSIQGNLMLETDIYLHGNITLISGNLDLSDYNLHLGGDIIGETENTRIFTKGIGEIIKHAYLQSGQAVNPGNIGLGLKISGNNSDVEFKRGHNVNFNSSSESINRYFSISEIEHPIEIVFNYFDAELNNLDEESLSVWGEQFGQWNNLNSFYKNIDENYLRLELNNSFQKLTLFEDTERTVIIPNGFSPNGDGVNDYFIIIGIENYPNNKLIILNRWGDIVFESENYNNNWGGTSESGIIHNNNKLLLNGTYFYFFYKDKSNMKDLEKGFFEIKGKSY